MLAGDDQGEVAAAVDFFISYTAVDKAWAEWIAWQLEMAGYSVLIQAWDFRPGHNFPIMMNRAMAANHTILVLSPAFLEANFTQPEWAAAFTKDPTGVKRSVIPVRVEPCRPDGLLGPIVRVDLVGISDKAEAILRLLEGVREGRAKPSHEPPFPGDLSGPSRRKVPLT